MSAILSSSELNTLKKSLPRGFFVPLVEKTGYNKNTITNVFSGKCKDVEIIDKVVTEAIKLKQQNDKKAQAIAKKIQEAIS